MSPEALFDEVRRVSALLSAHGRPDGRIRLLAVLVAPLADRDRVVVLRYEVGLLIEQPCPAGARAELEVLRGMLQRAAR